LSEADLRRVEQLKQRDREVRAHEMAHVAAGAGVVTSGASYSYETGPDGRRYAVGGEAEARNIDIVTRICALMDEMHPQGAPHDRLISFVTDRPGHDARYAIDPSRIRAELGWQPSVTLDDGLRQTVRWFLDNPGWWGPLLQRQGVGQRLGTAGC